MGRVFRAFDTHLERWVALKILPNHLREDAQFRERFDREPRFLAQLQHPGIVAVHDSGRTGPVQYLVMDLVDGVSLHELVVGLHGRFYVGARHRLTGQDVAEVIGRPTPDGQESLLVADSYDRTVARIIRGVARALEAAHSQDILHRDLKPNNVMIRGGGHPVILDFGLAGSREAPAAGDEMLCGAVPYLAPEQVKNQVFGADVRTDVYQLGLLLYELLTLQRTLPGRGRRRHLQPHHQG